MQKKLVITVLTIMLIITLTLTLHVSFVNASPITFNMDTLPENQGWTINKDGNATSSVSNGILTIDNNDGYLNYIAPADWTNTVNFTKGWIIEFRLKLENSSISSQFNPLIRIDFVVTNPALSIELYENRISVSGFQYLMNTIDNFHVYRFVKQENILRVFVDEKFVLDVPVTETRDSTTLYIFSTVAYTKSYWDYISYDTKPNVTFTFPTLTVVDGTLSYYISNLSGVTVDSSLTLIPNGTYAGWCVDKSVVMIRNVTHNVILYPSINGTVPNLFPQISWTYANYILNHKQGTMQEIQNAIWYFYPSFVSPPLNETVTWSMINNAKANSNYVPGKGEIMAVIAYAGHNSGLGPSGNGVQNTILEYRIP